MNLASLANVACYRYCNEYFDNGALLSNREIILRARSIFSQQGEDPVHVMNEINQIEKITNEQKLLFIIAFIEAGPHVGQTCFAPDLIEPPFLDLSKINLQDQNKRTPFLMVCESSSLLNDLDFVQFLINQGADVEIEDIFGYTGLMHAILNGRIDLINLLLDSQAKTESKGMQGFSPLHLAAMVGNLEIAKLLVGRGAYLDVKNDEGFTPLYTAYKRKHLEIVKFLIESEADSTSLVGMGFTILHIAAQDGNLDIVKLLIEKGAPIDAKTAENNTALQIAVEEGQLDIVRILIENKADLKLTQGAGITCLHQASKKGYLEIMQLLIDHGACVNAVTERQNTSLHFAVKHQRLDAVRLLIANKADLHKTTKRKETALYMAIQLNNLDIAKMLIEEILTTLDEQKRYPILEQAYRLNLLEMLRLFFEKGTAVNARDLKGNTLLHLASHQGKTEMIEFLLEMGADINARTEEGITPLHSACLNRNEEAVQLLIAHGADLNAASHKGLTPLHNACSISCLKIIKLLVQHEVKINVRTLRGWTPLHVASKNGCLETIKFLVEKGAFLDEITKVNKTALYIAADLQKFEVVNLLLDLGAGRNQKINDAFRILVNAMEENHLGIFLSLLKKNEGVRALFYRCLKEKEFCRHLNIDSEIVERGREMIERSVCQSISKVYLEELALFSSIEIDTSSHAVCGIDDLSPSLKTTLPFKLQILAAKHRAAVLHFFSSNRRKMKFYKKLIGKEFGIWGSKTSLGIEDSFLIHREKESIRSKFLSRYFTESFVFSMREELVRLYQKHPQLFTDFLQEIDHDVENCFEIDRGGRTQRLKLRHAIQVMIKSGLLKSKSSSSELK